jgi:hypothetical protein
MSIHQVQVVPAEQGILFCPDCSQKMRIIMAIPTHGGRERRTYECAYGHRKSIEVSLNSSPTISRAQRLSIHETTSRAKISPLGTRKGTPLR